jgi:hypothetical protein
MKLPVNLGISLMYAQLSGRLQMANKFSLPIHNSEVPASIYFSIFSCCIKSDHQPQKDLARSDYKANTVLGILLRVGEPLKPIN